MRTDKLTSASGLAQVMSAAVASAAAQGLSKDEVMRKASASRNLPPHEPTATTPEDAYPLALLIPPVAMSALDLDAFFKAARTPEVLERWKSKQQVGGKAGSGA